LVGTFGGFKKNCFRYSEFSNSNDIHIVYSNGSLFITKERGFSLTDKGSREQQQNLHAQQRKEFAISVGQTKKEPE
jgi:hypothetical protein